MDVRFCEGRNHRREAQARVRRILFSLDKDLDGCRQPGHDSGCHVLSGWRVIRSERHKPAAMIVNPSRRGCGKSGQQETRVGDWHLPFRPERLRFGGTNHGLEALQARTHLLTPFSQFTTTVLDGDAVESAAIGIRKRRPSSDAPK